MITALVALVALILGVLAAILAVLGVIASRLADLQVEAHAQTVRSLTHGHVHSSREYRPPSLCAPASDCGPVHAPAPQLPWKTT